jgi:hypothetical protein
MDSGAGNVDQGIVERDFATDDLESSTTPKGGRPTIIRADLRV